MKTESIVKHTPKDDKVAYSHNLSRAIHLKKDFFDKGSLMLKYGIITVLHFSNCTNPFLHRKNRTETKFAVDLKKINRLIADGSTKNNHPVSTLSDAAQHMAGRSVYCKLDCSHAYHCLQMADQRSVEMLAFNFAC